MTKIAFAGSQPRTLEFPLEWPLVLTAEDGSTTDVNSITLRRLNGGEVAALQEAVTGGNIDEAAMIAMFADQPGEVIAALDADDLLALKDKVVDFLPKALRRALEVMAAEQAFLTGDLSSQTLPTALDGLDLTS